MTVASHIIAGNKGIRLYWIDPGPRSSADRGSAGGSLIASAPGPTAYFVSWSPRQGFEIDDVVRGPRTRALREVRSEDLDVLGIVKCRNGVPEMVETEADN